MAPPPIPPPPKGYNAASLIQQTVDEDSSSSGNSAEPTDVFSMAIKAARDGPGVTPGLRRRRERAERQKTFIREQQEAAAAGLRVFDAKEDPDIHGKFNCLFTAFAARRLFTFSLIFDCLSVCRCCFVCVRSH